MGSVGFSVMFMSPCSTVPPLQRLALDQFAACLVAVVSDTDHFTTGPHPS